MAHFAKLDENNVVLSIHVVNNDVMTLDGVEIEQMGINFLTQLHRHTNWKQTSYNGSFRRQYAGIGFIYDPIADIFIELKPFPSWSLDENNNWQSPKPKPEKPAYWDEDLGDWVLDETPTE